MTVNLDLPLSLKFFLQNPSLNSLLPPTFCEDGSSYAHLIMSSFFKPSGGFLPSQNKCPLPCPDCADLWFLLISPPISTPATSSLCWAVQPHQLLPVTGIAGSFPAPTPFSLWLLVSGTGCFPFPPAFCLVGIYSSVFTCPMSILHIIFMVSRRREGTRPVS